MNKNLSQSSQSVLESLADAIDQMIHIVETHDYSKKDNLLAVSAMSEHLGNKFGIEKLCLQLVFSSVINGTEGEQAYHTLQGRYGGVKPGEKKEPKTVKVSEKKALLSRLASLEAQLAARNAPQDQAPATEPAPDTEHVSEEDLQAMLESV